MNNCFSDILDNHKKKILSDGNPSEFWWCLDSSLSLIKTLLDNKRYICITDFLLNSECNKLHDEVLQAYNDGLLSSPGSISGGRKGDIHTKVNDVNIRNDTLGYFDGIEADWPKGNGLKRALDKINTLVFELRDSMKDDDNELKYIQTRSRAMITCYGGNGARYTRHCDNPISNGRKLTAILYVNKNWNVDTDGGCIRLYEPHNSNSNAYVDIKPQFNSLLMFWSDTRCPHEVLPCYRNRFAITVWFIDSKEKQEADESQPASDNINDNNTSDSNNVFANNNVTDVFE